MTLINDSKSFTFFEFLDYDLLEKERTEIRHLIFEKKGLIIVPRDRNNAQDCIIEGYRFTMMKIENRNYLRILCKWKRENSWEDSRRAAQNDTDTLLQEPRSLCIWVMPLYTLCLPFLLYRPTYNCTCIPIYILIDS